MTMALRRLLLALLSFLFISIAFAAAEDDTSPSDGYNDTMKDMDCKKFKEICPPDADKPSPRCVALIADHAPTDDEIKTKSFEERECICEHKGIKGIVVKAKDDDNLLWPLLQWAEFCDVEKAREKRKMWIIIGTVGGAALLVVLGLGVWGLLLCK